jgi:hypothetical protein
VLIIEIYFFILSNIGCFVITIVIVTVKITIMVSLKLNNYKTE